LSTGIGEYTLIIDGVNVKIDNIDIYNDWVVNEKNMSFYLNGSKLEYVRYVYVDDAAVTLLKSKLNTAESAYMYDLYLLNTYTYIDVGRYSVLSIMTQLALKMKNLRIDEDVNIIATYSDKPGDGLDTITQLAEWQCPIPFFLDMKKSSIRSILGFSELAHPTSSSLFTTFQYNDNTRLFMSVFQGNYIVRAPGIVNLESVEYIILRCPEIESHLLGSYFNFKYSPGIALFKLTTSNTLINLRFDFLNIARKPFHPIGKLSRLTFRYELNDGTLYDFKGLENVLLFSIKYYDPKNIQRIPRSVLNPYYSPNLLEYQMKEFVSKEINDVDDIIKEQKKYMLHI
jgi:hypothetical protein